MDNNEQAPTWLDLYDYRRRVARLYRLRNQALRAGKDEQTVLNDFRAAKDRLFAQHPQSAISVDQRSAFKGLRYFPYNPELCVEGVLQPVITDDSSGEALSPNPTPLKLAAQLFLRLENTDLQLQVYWIDVYGGSLFLPFRDLTSGGETYGGGRYLFDTAKGSDFLQVADQPARKKPLGFAGGRVLIDFNYAYNPSCVYDPRWACPLAPRENWLKVAIKAGEMQFYS